jgi:hypothetical protein
MAASQMGLKVPSQLLEELMGPQTKVEKKLEMLRVAGAIANYRLTTNLNRLP